MALRICAAAGKVAFVRHSQAEKVVASYRKKAASGVAEAPRSAYRCAVCRRWHVTGQSPQEAADWKRAQGKPPMKRKPRLKRKPK